MAAMMMNISGTTPVEDPEYRYKMPRLVGKVEGRGNGIKTAIPNMTQVAAALHRPAGEVTKFFGCELGAQTTWTEETERAIVNGAHTTQVLQDKLSIYIEKFVLCPSCRLPETSYKIKNDMIYHQCVACGFRGSVDMQHKLTTFILKSHKLEKKAREKDKKKSKGEDDDGRKKKKKQQQQHKDGGKAELTDAEKAEKKRKKKEKAEKLVAAAEDAEAADASEDEDAVDDTGALDSAINGLRAFVSKSPEPVATMSEVRAVQTFCALPRTERAYILVAALFGDGDASAALSPDAKALAILSALKSDSGPMALIGGFEKLAAVDHESLQSKFPIILKKLYDADVLEEQAILDWHRADHVDRDVHLPDAVDDDMHQKLLKATDPFITWLKEAEEDGEEDGEDDDED
ncbi:hypothetical protein CTAYLR_003931 [Chrysophaeum taylorii]|uniref:W2 domain-containing protein n=1 Tax=Chrysophaeum taylorii TaxID=2483200 RepID=A0AAD7XJR4_9STRA|nr:hypothetical protein CTAYLR_003931 [Chrysophaeum taylorii]